MDPCSCSELTSALVKKNVWNICSAKAPEYFFSRKNISMFDFFYVIELTDDFSELTVLGCSKLTTSLVNVSLKFQVLISEILHYFLLKNVWSFCVAKASLIFSTKNISVFGYKVAKHITS